MRQFIILVTLMTLVTFVCSILDSRDAFDFHIVNFLDLSGNIPTDPVYGTYISQLIRYSRACHDYDNFSSGHSMLVDRLANQLQCFSATKLMRAFTIMGKYPEIVSKFKKSPSSMIDSSFPMAQLDHTFTQLMK